MDIRPITNCRLCLSPNLEQALKLADIPLADGYSKEPKEARFYPDELWICMECGHAQMGHMLNPELMFREYHFHSGDSHQFVAHLKMMGDDIIKRFNPKSVLEVGSNDGTLLSYMQKMGVNVVGVDPANVYSPVTTYKEFFTTDVAKRIVSDFWQFDCVIANHVFAHADYLVGMLEAIRNSLAPKGVFVFENAYVLDLVKGGYYDQIYHEHPSYHALGPLQEFFMCHGLELFDAERNECKGGSVRGFVQHKGGPHLVNHEAIGELLAQEKQWGCYDPSGYKAITRRLEKQREALPVGKMIGYGAASSVTPVIYNLELQDRLEFLVDDNPRKHGLRSPGANIPIKHPDAIYESSLLCVNLALRFPGIAKKHPKKWMLTLP